MKSVLYKEYTIEDFETKGGLLYWKGETELKFYIPLPEADTIAQKLGFLYVERLVEFLKNKA